MGILESAASKHLKLLVVVGITQIIPSPQNKEEFNFWWLVSTKCSKYWIEKTSGHV